MRKIGILLIILAVASLIAGLVLFGVYSHYETSVNDTVNGFWYLKNKSIIDLLTVGQFQKLKAALILTIFVTPILGASGIIVSVLSIIMFKRK